MNDGDDQRDLSHRRSSDKEFPLYFVLQTPFELNLLNYSHQIPTKFLTSASVRSASSPFLSQTSLLSHPYLKRASSVTYGNQLSIVA